MLNQVSSAADTKQVTASPCPSYISAIVFVISAHQLFLPTDSMPRAVDIFSGAT